LTAAESLIASGSLREADGRPEINRTPGYPLFLVACGLSGPLGYGIAQIVQVLLDLFLVFLTYRFAAQLIGPMAALMAAALQALSVPAIVSSVLIMSDDLFALIITLTIATLVRYFREQQWRLLALSAVLTALATYVRPVGLMFAAVVAIALLIRANRFRNTISYLLVFAGLVSPWFVRNHIEAGYNGFSSISDKNLLPYEAASVRARLDGISQEEARRQLLDIYEKRLRYLHLEAGSVEALRVKAQMGREILHAHLATWVFVRLLTTAGSLLPDSANILQMYGATTGNRGTLSVLQAKGPRAAVKYYFDSNPGAVVLMLPEVIILIAKYLACGVFLILCPLYFRKFHWDASELALVLLTIAMFLAVGGPVAVARFRLPAEPMLNLIAAGGVFLLIHHRRRGSVLRLPVARAQEGIEPTPALSGAPKM
jgi:4-amino-4-deoxy-L-arabinose transferase-like glycosyltransferase